MSAFIMIPDANVSKGYQGAAQAKFTKLEGKEKGILGFKIGVKVWDRKEGKNVYNNYTVSYFCSEGDRLVGILNTEGVRISIVGKVSQEEYNGSKFNKIDALEIEPKYGTYGEAKKEETPAAGAPAPGPTDY